MYKPLISVVIPVYNGQQFIGRALESVLSQSYSNIEILVIDDASEDKTIRKVKKYKDKRIELIRNVLNCGPAASRNIGLKKSRGKLIAFLDADDVWHPYKLEKQMRALTSRVDGAYTKCRVMVRGEHKKVIIPTSKHRSQGIYRESYIKTPSVLVRKTCVNKVRGFDEKLQVCEDWDFFMRLSRVCKLKYLDEVLVLIYPSRYRRSIKERRQDYRKFAQSCERMIEKHSDVMNTKLKAWYSYTIGVSYLKGGDEREGKYWLKKSLSLNPLNIKTRVQILAGALGSGKYLKLRSLYRKFFRMDIEK